MKAISQEKPQTTSTEINLKITCQYLKFISNFPGANELMRGQWVYYGHMTLWTHGSIVTSYGDKNLESTSAQVMACFLMVPSHYLNQHWLIINGVLWHSPKINFTVPMISTHRMCLKNTLVKLLPHLPGANELTHWGRDKMDAISQTTISNAFLWMKMLEFLSIFHWSLFLMV